MGAVLGLVLALVPLLIVPHLLFYFDVTPKAVALLFGTAAALILFAVKGTAQLWSTRRGRWFLALLAAQALALVLAAVFSAEPALSWGGTNWRRFGLVTQSAILLFAGLTAEWLAGNAARVTALLRVTAAAGTIAACYGIMQYFGVDFLLPAQAYRSGEGIWTIVRPPGTLGHASYFANYLVMAVFCGAALARVEGARGWRIVAACAALLGALAILLSGTRAAIAGLAIGAAYLLRARFSWRALAGMAAVAAVFAAVYVSPLGVEARARTRWSIEDPLGGARLLLWRDTLRMAAQRPAAGYGPEAFTPRFPRYQSAELARAYPDFYQESPHNVFLDAAAAGGLAGLAPLLGLCGLGFLAAHAARDKHRELSPALAAGLAATLVSHQFSVFVIPTALCFYVLLAALAALGCEPAPPARRSAWAAAAGVALALVLAWFAARLLVADRYLAVTAARLDSGDARGAFEAYQRARTWRPAGAGSDLWYSRRLFVFAQSTPGPALRARVFQEAFQAAIRAASQAEDRANALYNLGAFYAAQNDYALTDASLRAAIRAAPNWFKPHWTLAQALALAGRREEAEREAARAADLNAGQNPEVAASLESIRAGRATSVNPAPGGLPVGRQ